MRYVLMGMAYGGYLMWKGITGNIWRSGFTGEPVIPRWLYIVTGVLLVLLGAGWFVTREWLQRM